MTVAYFEIVKELPKDSYGLIFGFNTFVALGIQVILCQKHSSINPTWWYSVGRFDYNGA